MLVCLLRKFANYNSTCSITNLKDRSVSFIRDEKYIPYLKKACVDAWVIAHNKFKELLNQYQEYYCPTINIYYTDYPEFEFCLFHNKINENIKNSSPAIGKRCKIHKTAILDADGLKVINSPNGEKIQFKHTGHVVIGDDVEIGPYTVIHRGTMDLTTISSNCKIAALCNIGHNCYIGYGNIFAAGVVLNGGVKTGRGCWFASSSAVKHYTSITDNVVVGLGSIVVKDITQSGIYIGNPAKFLKPLPKRWNF